MNKNIILLFFASLPILVTGQEVKRNKSIEINAGHANYNYNLNGVFLNAGFSRSFNKYLAVCGSLALANGSNDSNNNSFVNDKFQLGLIHSRSHIFSSGTSKGKLNTSGISFGYQF